MKATIIITSFNEPNTIKKAIDSFLNQKVDYNFEIIIVTPDKEIEEIVENYKNKTIKYFKDPAKGKAFALNLIFKKLFSKDKNHIMIFSDGDVFVSENSINEIMRKFEDPEIGAVTGRPVAINSREKMVDYFSNLLLDAGAHKARLYFDKNNKFLECTGYLFAIRNGLIENIPHLDVAEDSIIPYLIWKQGYKIKYASEARVYVKYPSTLKDFVKQRKRSGVGSHSKLKKYYNDFPRMKSFSNEIKRGFIWSLQYPKSIKELVWTIFLFFIRLYIWFIYYFEAIFRKKSYKDAWEQIKSTK